MESRCCNLEVGADGVPVGSAGIARGTPCVENTGVRLSPEQPLRSENSELLTRGEVLVCRLDVQQTEVVLARAPAHFHTVVDLLRSSRNFIEANPAAKKSRQVAGLFAREVKIAGALEEEIAL